jgi:hypothetical protein
MSVEIEKVSDSRKADVFRLVNEYIAAVLSGDLSRMETAFTAMKEMQDDE